MIGYVAALLLAGSLVLTPAFVAADPTDGFIVSESLRRKYEGLPNRYAPKPSTPYQFKSRSYTSPLTGYSRYNYKFKSGGQTYKGRIETFPGGTTRHKGSWR